MDGTTTGKVQQHVMSVFCASKGRTTGQLLLLGAGCVQGRVVTAFFPGGQMLVESMSPVLALGHEEQHLADTAETIFQRGEGQERQLGSAL